MGWTIEHAGVPNPSSEADLDEVGAEGFLPTLGGIPHAVQAQSKFADFAAAEPGIFRRKLDEDVPVDLCVEIRSSDIIDHHFFAAIVRRRCRCIGRGLCGVADKHSEASSGGVAA